MYQLRKLDVNTVQPRDAAEWVMEYSTWRELVADLADRERYANEVFHGRGAQICRDGEVIGNTLTFGFILAPIKSVTLAQFLKTTAELAEA